MPEKAINLESMLRVGTILHGSYRIDRYLSSGGFGNTYVATHIDFDETYAVKEFFMKGVTQRDGNNTSVSVSNREKVEEFKGQLEKFKKEARRLRRLNNPHIVRVHDLFEENGTAYYVMDYVDGENLKDRLKRTGRPMTESEVRLIIPQILDALKTVHDAGIWHLDLKPANIMLEKGGMIKLIDFGASKQYNVQKGGATTGTAISYTPGYAPREQMEQSYEKFGPWTDFYALGGTLYNLLTNQRPPMPTDIDDDRSEDKHLALPLPSTISEKMKALILWMMKTYRNDRPVSVQKIYEFIEKGPTPEPDPVQRQEPANVEDDITVIEERHESKPSPKESLSQEHTDKTDEHEVEIEEAEEHNGGHLKKFGVAFVILCFALGGYFLWNSNRTMLKGFVSGNDSEAVYINTDSIWTVDEIPMPHLKDASCYVSNPDTVISMDTENRINNILKKLDDVFSIESVFVVVNHVENDDVDSFALNLGNKYGVGKDNRGIVYVLAYKDRAYRISITKGLEKELTNEICSQLIDKTIPDLKAGNPDAATELLANEIYSFFEAHYN